MQFRSNSVGGFTCKSDVNGGTCAPGSTGYGYGPTSNSPIAGPHAVTAVTGTVNGVVNPTYVYDANGNMTNRAGTVIAWNSDNLPTNITQDAGDSSAFSYAPDKHRYMQTAMTGGVKETTVYVGAMEGMTSGANPEQFRHTLMAYGKPVVLATITLNSSGNPTLGTHYLLTDHLGSVDTVIDGTSGAIMPQQSFDAFGSRRDAGSWHGPMASADLANARAVTHHGFTQHEHLDSVGLVDANGRMLDPVVGRFLSVDPIYQSPKNSQSVNPYSYVMNNPLSLVDPTGYDSACPDQSLSGCSGGQNSDSNTTKTSATDVGSHIAHHGDTTTTTTTEANGNKVVSHSGNGFGIGESASVSMDGDNGATHGMTGTTMPSASNAGGSANQGSESQKPTTTNAGDRNLTGPCEDPTACDKPATPTSDASTSSTTPEQKHPVYAVADGKVMREGWQKEAHTGSDSGLGYRISIDDSKGYYQYGHMDPATVTIRVGDTVHKGDLIGSYADPTNGSSTGPHVHLEYRSFANPRQTLNPGLVSPLGPSGRITTPYGAVDSSHGTPHQGVDWAYPRE